MSAPFFCDEHKQQRPMSTPSDTPRTDYAVQEARLKYQRLYPHLKQFPVHDTFARTLEREFNAALVRVAELEAREKAIVHFCETEMLWEYFRAEFSLSKNPTQTEQNADKLRHYLEQHGGLPAQLPAPQQN